MSLFSAGNGMSDRFLLYIDILGFSEMVRKEPRKVVRVYEILDTLNVHGRSDFKVIVFSDTILVYNSIPASSVPDRTHCVQALVDFASDLHNRLVGQDIFFRAVLVKGDFEHYKLKNVECFFGSALIDAYHAEKEIPSLGLFVSDDCKAFGVRHPTVRFSPGLSFVFLCEGLQALSTLGLDRWPFTLGGHLDETFAVNVPWDVRFLKDVYNQMRENTSPAVRTKYLTAWDLYHQKYNGAMDALVRHDFETTALATDAWTSVTAQMNTKIRKLKRIGSGTELSKSIQKSSTALNRKKRFLGIAP
ncbi:hypothetical protein [Pseudomonas sp. S3E12]|uniref:hypothetical protein n=1 Tax=Pseudomonas sp. S3E12 TaxID=1873126 RepID=UPI00081C1421|nr:hypothetical protein [Pseudomonas sp. S3E12]OCW20440.1 hypothetical protein BB029_26800 [Pseudomonas sp. S3E12]